ncbi:MAG: HAMP domain-containing histidine kinase, partial [Gemmatimonadaceae bacterium]|nr:HAMP domain-containing histidine kinase [Gemmatimonadaceae bacterium]
GIPADVVHRVFEPFFTTKGERGTGLGLPIVEQLVGKAGGYVRVESTPGNGTTFRLFLPRLAPAA